MANGIEQEKEALRQELRQMMAQGVDQAEIIAHRDAKLAEIEGKQAAAQQAANAQQGQGITDSSAAGGSSESAYSEVGGYEAEAAQPRLEEDPQIGGWENLVNNTKNVMNRIYGFDDRLTLATVDVMDQLFGKEIADKIWSVMPAYDQTSGEWLDSSEEVRANAYQELAELEAANHKTVGLLDSWDKLTKEEGDGVKDVGLLLSAAGGAGLNMLSTLITSGLTAGAGLYTDMIGDAIVDANTEKAKRLGISVQELYDSDQSEFAVPAAVGVAGGMLERMGALGVSKYINKAAGKPIKDAVLAMVSNSGTEGATEWLQFGLETYNNERARGNEEAAGKALEDLFTREGAEMALQGAVGALVGGQAGRAGRRGAEAIGLVAPAGDLSEAQDTPEYAFNPKDSEKKYTSKVKATEEAQAEQEVEATGEEYAPNQEVFEQQKRDEAREKRSQDRETRRLIQELEEEYEGTAQDLDSTDKTAYVLRGLEDQAGIKTVDEAADLSKSRQRDVMALVTKAASGMRSAEEIAKIDNLNIQIHEAAKALESTSDPAQQEALQLFIDDAKDDVANIVTNSNRKVLMASPRAVADAVESASELARIEQQESAIQENNDLPQNLKDGMLANLQNKKNAAFERGEVARAEIEKTSAQNAELVDDNSTYLQQLLDEEVQENDKKTDAIISEASDLGLIPDPDGDLVTDETLAEGRQAIAGEDGVKEYGKTFGGNFGSRTEAIQAGIKLQQAAKAKGYKTDINYVDVNPSRPGGDTQVVAEIYAPRQEAVNESVNKLKNQQEQELGEEGIVEEAPVEGVQEEERTPLSYVSDFAPEAQETALPGGEIFLPGEDAKAAGAYRAVGGLKKRGHAEAKFDKIGGGFLVTPGPRQEGDQIEYSLDEEVRIDPETGEVLLPGEEAAPIPKSKEKIDEHTFQTTDDYVPGGVELSLEEGPKNFKVHNELGDKVGNRVKLNIGLENNPLNYSQIVDRLKNDPNIILGTTEQVDGEYNGEPERTLVLSAKFNGTGKEFRSFIEGLNKELTQEAIGAQFNNRGSLIYDPDYQGDRYTFDKQYFLEPTKIGQESVELKAKEPSPKAARRISEQKVEDDLRKEMSALLKKKDITEEDAVRLQEIAQKLPSKGQPRDVKRRALSALQQGPESKLEPGVQLGKDVVEREGTEAFDPSVNRDFIDAIRSTPVEDLKKEPNITDSLIDRYNDDLVSDDQFARSLAKYIVTQQPDIDLQGFAFERLISDVVNGKFRDKTKSQVFTKAKSIARGARQDQRKAYGENVRTQRIKNVARRAEDAFYAENGYEPGLQELANYINDNTAKYRLENVTPEQIEASRFDEVASGVELGGVQGAARDIAQTRAAKEAGFDQLTDAIATPDLVRKIDDKVSEWTAQAPVVETKGKGRTDAAATTIKKAGTKIDQAIGRDISDLVNASMLKNNFAELREILNIPQKSWDDLSRAQKQDLKRKVVKGLAQEAEQRLGKQTTPSQEYDFSIEEGSATRVTDTGAKSKKQVNSHGQNWQTTANEINNSIRNTNFDNDWVQWSPGKLDPTSDKAKRMSPKRVSELLRQPGRVAKIAARNGLKLRSDLFNPGLYHIYKPGKPGSPNIEAQYDGWEALERANPNYINIVSEALQKAWPSIEIVNTKEDIAKAARELGVAPERVKGAYVVGQNKVLINPGMATYDTPIHEFGHIWAKQLMRENPELWKRGVELLKGSEYMKAVDSIPAYRKYREDGNLAKFYEEVMANAIGKRGYQIFGSERAAGKWDSWMNKVGDWIKNKLGIKSDKPYADLTLDDWLEVATHGVFTGTTPPKPSDKTIEYSIAEDPTMDNDVSAAYLRGQKNQGKWYKNPLKWLIPPAADDYHGLVSKLKNIAGVQEVTDAFIKNHQKHIDDVTNARKKIADITKKLGIPLDKKDVVTYKGNKLNAAQAIQAHVNGFPNDFSKKPEVRAYIKAMTDLGVLKPNDRYDLASPSQDIYQYLNNDLYQKNFQEFNEKKAQIFNPEVMNTIRAEHGEKYATALEGALQRMASGKNSRGFTDKTTQKWNDWALGSVGTIMFLNFRSAALQMLSVGNFAFEAKSPGRFIANFFDPATFAEAKKLYNSSYLKERRARAGFDVNAAEMIDAIKNSRTFSDFTKKVLNKGFAATSFVDSMAIAMGGAAFIKSQMDSGVSRKDAISQWKEATEEAQQSARPDRVSQWQTEGVSKFVLAFANTPQQYFRLAQKAARSIKEGKDVKRNLAKIGYYMFAQNLIFTAAQAASTALLGFGDEGDDDEERDQLSSMAGSILRGMGLYGAIIDSAKNVIVQAIKEEGKANPDHINSVLKATSISPPLNRKIQDLLAIGRAHKYDSDDKYATTVTRGIAATTNLPADWAHKKYDAAKALWDDQYAAHQKLLMLMGWSKWNFKDNESGDFDFDISDLDIDDIDLDDLDLDI